MKQLVILSGKGGTGKTTLTASFAALSGRCVLADADVDAADLHLVVTHTVRENNTFISGQEAVIDHTRCIDCGLCLDLCRFEAIIPSFDVDPLACEGCRVCYDNCPVSAIDMLDRDCGRWFSSDAGFGPFIHARLNIAAENSGKLVSLVREKAREQAELLGIDLILIDGPPGVGCPVIASITGCDVALIVTEPTQSGLHDLRRAAELTRHFEVPTFAVVNKADLHEGMTLEIETWCEANGIRILGRIPFDTAVVEAMTQKTSLAEFSNGTAALAVRHLWERLEKEVRGVHG
jgi:MinD superfamily P-loop ATPase